MRFPKLRAPQIFPFRKTIAFDELYIYRGVHQFSSKASIAALDRGKVNFPAFAYAEILHEIKDLTKPILSIILK